MNKKILIVDDDAELVEATRVLLETKNYQVLSASCGVEGVAKAKSEKPDLLLLDVMMTHDSEGLEVARDLRADPSTAGIPVILVTGVRREKKLPFRFEPDQDWLPVREVLEKPVKPETLLQAIERVFTKKG